MSAGVKQEFPNADRLRAPIVCTPGGVESKNKVVVAHGPAHMSLQVRVKLFNVHRRNLSTEIKGNPIHIAWHIPPAKQTLLLSVTRYIMHVLMLCSYCPHPTWCE